jgi:hypothetical protein
MPRGRPRKNANTVLVRSAELIGWALGGLEREIVETRDRLAALTAQAGKLRKRLGRRAGQAVAAGAEAIQTGRRRRRRMTAEGRKRISDMMKKRWAERRRAKKKGRLGQ